MPRSPKNIAAASGTPSSTTPRRATGDSVDVAGEQTPVKVPIPMVTDAELYGYPAYEYPGYNTDPDFDFPEELVDWGGPEPDPEPPLDWGLPDDDDNDEEEASIDAVAGTPVTAPGTNNAIHSLLDYFAAHALNGLLSARPVVPEISFDAAQTAHLAYNCAEAMLREREERLANQREAPYGD